MTHDSEVHFQRPLVVIVLTYILYVFGPHGHIHDSHNTVLNCYHSYKNPILVFINHLAIVPYEANITGFQVFQLLSVFIHLVGNQTAENLFEAYSHSALYQIICKLLRLDGSW